VAIGYVSTTPSGRVSVKSSERPGAKPETLSVYETHTGPDDGDQEATGFVAGCPTVGTTVTSGIGVRTGRRGRNLGL
jgi:hypothetical protein